MTQAVSPEHYTASPYTIQTTTAIKGKKYIEKGSFDGFECKAVDLDAQGNRKSLCFFAFPPQNFSRRAEFAALSMLSACSRHQKAVEEAGGERERETEKRGTEREGEGG